VRRVVARRCDIRRFTPEARCDFVCGWIFASSRGRLGSSTEKAGLQPHAKVAETSGDRKRELIKPTRVQYQWR